MLVAKQGTNFRKALDYVIPAVDKTPYGWWSSGIVPDGAPAYAVNRPAPDIRHVIERGIFCAGVANVMLRRVGKRVPTRGDLRYDGGTVAYWGNSRYGPGYFTGYDEPFNMARALKWAQQARSGVLLGRRYRTEGINNDQGHVAILLPSGYVLQSIPGGGSLWPGLNWTYNLDQSHDGGYYERMVHPENWIDYEGDNF